MIKISNMTGKLEGMPAINTNTLTNNFCKKMHKNVHPQSICAQCYSFRMLETYRANCATAWQKNSDILSKSVLSADELPVINNHSFRFDGHGELINLTHYFNLIRIAKKNQGCHFALWTKRLDIIRRASKSVSPDAVRPENLILIYSNPMIDRVMHKPPPGFDKVFNNTSDRTRDDNCSGRKCIDCLQCYRHESGVDCIIEQVKH